MYDIFQAPFIREMKEMTANMYRMGWDERNGGNISVLLDAPVVEAFIDPAHVQETIGLSFDASALAGRYVLVTRTGGYFKNIESRPQENLGLVRIAKDGGSYDVMWGFAGGGRPTSEFPTHLMNHIVRLKADACHRVVLQCHPVNTLAMTFVHTLDEREFTRTLWKMCTECMVVFPDGVGVLPWMVCGGNEIGEKTAEKIADRRLVVWAQHGIFGTGRDMDEAFGLVETVEKAAEIYMKILGHPIVQAYGDKELHALAEAFHLTPRAGYLD